MFDIKKHAQVLMEVEEVVGSIRMISDGMRYANGCMDNDKFSSMATGAFRLMSMVLNKTIDAISEECTTFVLSHGLKYPIEDNTYNSI